MGRASDWLSEPRHGYPLSPGDTVLSAKERRIRRQRHPDTRPAGLHANPDGEAKRALRPLPEWKWTTFPVFCALSVGLFVGVYAGFIAGLNDESHRTFQLVVFITAALFLGLSFSRLMTRFLVSRNWVRPRAKQ